MVTKHCGSNRNEKKCLECCKMGIPIPLSTSVLFYLEQERARGSTIVMVSTLNSGSICRDARPGRGHCIMFVTKTFYFYTASLLAGIFIVTGVLQGQPEKMLGSTRGRLMPHPGD